MSWVRENCLSFFQMFCIKVVKTGRIPKHVAFIMDGNRRYAKKNSVDNSAGHYKGFDKLSETLRWCLDLGIPEVTVYAFSIENFKRSKEEVDGLMDLARDKFRRLMDEIDQINEWGVRIHIAGRLSLLPEDLQALVSKSMLATKHNNKLRLNIAYAYTGRDEISRAASHIVDGVKNNDLPPEDIDDELVSKILELREAELLVRTSGEVRLSDFMLWQVSNTVLYFTEVLWPEFSIWNLLAAIIHFQRYAPSPKQPEHLSDTKKRFLEKLESQRWQHIEKIVNCSLYA
ncbi:dehydrodolichyl diphosphate synthase complex subunit DHDDS [Spodoptera litura]|uniref:Alkyl transferase n=1 Tax=Spodoptera litura TaxID=69820 RepID=A0A9J7EEK2_SPOLT|nr:dehydrodolichyl diphosphate synthase complex subunit DHDDS [Spodoptera litura]